MKHSELRHQPRHVNPRIQDISRLRGRFKDIGLEDVIETRKGQGYILV